MNEGFPGFERKLEHIPILEEVRSVFMELVNKREYEEARRIEYKEVCKKEDQEGLYLLEARVPGDLPGEETEYSYMRKGHYPEGETSATEIHIVYYVYDFPVGGTEAARYIEGRWEIL
jgi:3-mercaptopyruvate sulfurtransferase SseA